MAARWGRALDRERLVVTHPRQLGVERRLPVLRARRRTASAQELRLKLSHFLPAAYNHHVNVIVPWAEEVKKRTGGRVEITIFPGASLYEPPQQYDCARSGIPDIAWGVTGWTPGRFPLSSVVELPYMHRTAAGGSQMLADLWDRYLGREYDDVHVLAMNVHPAGHVHTRLEAIRTLEDFKGMKIRAPTAVVGDLLDTLGATKVGMPANQIYEAISQRVVDGFGMLFEALPPFRFHEVSRYHTSFATLHDNARYESPPTCGRCWTRRPRRRAGTGGGWASRGTGRRWSGGRRWSTG